MAVIGNLVVALTSNTAGFTRGMGKARQQTKTFTAGLGVSTSAILKFGGALAAAAGVLGLGALVRSQSEAIDEMGKLADRVNATTEELIGLRHAAGLAGVDSAGFGKAIEIMVRRLGEAQQGTGEAVRGLEAMGIRLADLEGLSAGEQFLRLADGVASIQDPSLKAAAAYQVFGRQGQQLLNTLNQGSDALRAQVAEAESLGLMFSRVDAAKVEAANDAISRMRSAIGAVGKDIAIAIAPSVTNMATMVTGAIAHVRRVVVGAVSGMVGTAQSGIVSVVQFFAPYWAQLASTAGAAIGFIANTFAAGFSVIAQTVAYVLPSFDGFLSVIRTVQDFVVGALIALEFRFENWSQIAEYHTLNLAAKLVAFGGIVQHHFTVRVPTYLVYAAGVFQRFSSQLASVLGQLAVNIVQVFSNLPGLIAGTTEWDQVWTPIVASFDKVLGTLPQIPERQMGELEKSLTSQAAQLGSALDDSYDKFVSSRLAEIDATTAKIQTFTESVLGIDFKLPEMPKLTLDDMSMDAIDGFGKAKVEQVTLNDIGVASLAAIRQPRVGFDMGASTASMAGDKSDGPKGKQVDETNAILSRIEKRIGGPAVAVAA